jgi:hypothetical protein
MIPCKTHNGKNSLKEMGLNKKYESSGGE